MISQNIHNRMKHLLEETSDAFENCAGGMNADYASFASMSLADFQNLLKNPGLTAQDLRRFLRKGDQKQRIKDPEGSWSSFLANYVTKKSNQNSKESMR